ncbi:MAG: BNR-4 repeat-containing protein [Gemmatimonadota bacterium]
MRLRSASTLAILAAAPALGQTPTAPTAAPAPEPTVLVEDAAWTWFNDERAIFAGDRLLVGYVTRDGHSGAAVVEPDDPATVRTFRLGSFTEVDDHNNPSFVEREDGRVVAAYAPHNTRPYWFWRVTDGSAGPLVWGPERRTPELDAPATYSNLVRLAGEDDRLYNFFRGTNFDPVFVVSDDGGASWGPVRHFIRSGDAGTRPYVKYANDGTGRIDALYTQAHPRRGETNVYHVYYQDGHLHRTDGARIQPMPGGDVGPLPVEAGTRVYDAGQAGRAWVWDLEYGDDGGPVAVYIAARDSTVGNDLRYRHGRWDARAGTWREAEIAYAGTHLYDGENHYAGGITLDPRDTDTVFLSADVDPATGEPTDHYQIYRGHRNDGDGHGTSASWTWESLTPGAHEDHIRPFVPRGGGPHRVVLWLRGRYTTYLDFDTDVVALIERR